MELNKIIEETKNRKNLPNKKLIELMDLLVSEHEMIKKELVSLTYHFDKVEETYNDLLKEFETRKK